MAVAYDVDHYSDLESASRSGDDTKFNTLPQQNSVVLFMCSPSTFPSHDKTKSQILFTRDDFLLQARVLLKKLIWNQTIVGVFPMQNTRRLMEFSQFY